MSAVLNTESRPTVTSLADLRKPQHESTAVAVVGFGSLQGFELLQRGAKALAASSIIPKDYVGNVANCMVGLEMAERIGVSPLMLMQNMDVIYGRPALRAKFLIATFNQCGRYTTIKYKWQGAPGKDDWGCRAVCVEKSTGDEITGPLITIDLARKEGWVEKSGSKWKTIPELMLTYRAAAWMINTTAPELSMGLPTTEEAHDVFDAKRGDDGSFSVASVTDLHDVTLKTIDTDTGEVLPATNTPTPAANETEKPEPPAKAAPKKPSAAPVVTFAIVSEKLNAAHKAGDLDLLQAHADLIKQVPDEAQQKELYVLYTNLSNELTGGDAA